MTHFPSGSPPKTNKWGGLFLRKATTPDLILSFFLPGWGLVIGLIALVKGEYRRGLTMILVFPIFLILIAGIGWVVFELTPTKSSPGVSASPNAPVLRKGLDAVPQTVPDQSIPLSH